MSRIDSSGEKNDIAAALASSHRLSDWIQAEHPATFESGGGRRIAAIFYSIALDHREAILLLLHHGARSAAFALFRSVYEAWIRASWLDSCATLAEITFIEAGGAQPTVERMVRRLDALPDSEGMFSRIKRNNWESMSDFAHGGPKQVSRWITDTSIGAAHPDAEVKDLLQASDIYAVLCLAGLLRLANRQNDHCLNKLHEICVSFEAKPKNK